MPQQPLHFWPQSTMASLMDAANLSQQSTNLYAPALMSPSSYVGHAGPQNPANLMPFPLHAPWHQTLVHLAARVLQIIEKAHISTVVIRPFNYLAATGRHCLVYLACPLKVTKRSKRKTRKISRCNGIQLLQKHLNWGAGSQRKWLLLCTATTTTSLIASFLVWRRDCLFPVVRRSWNRGWRPCLTCAHLMIWCSGMMSHLVRSSSNIKISLVKYGWRKQLQLRWKSFQNKRCLHSLW